MEMRRRFAGSPATLIAIAALVVALAGTALAGSEPEAQNAASAKKIAKKARKAARKAKKAAGENAALLAQLCPNGNCAVPTGPKGDKGDQGDPGATNVAVRTASSAPGTTMDITESATASCSSGEVAVGGGAFASNVGNQNIRFITSFPQPIQPGAVPKAWEGDMASTLSTLNGQINVYVVCASP